MGDMGDYFREWKDHKRSVRDRLGRPCEGCQQNHPNRNPTILLPGQRCRWCGWRDTRRRKYGN